MAKQAGKIICKEAWRDPGELSLAEVHFRILAYWSPLLTVQQEMTVIRQLFRSQEMLWPDQCARILRIIDKICWPVREFRLFLDQSALLPPSICTARYPLAEALICLDIQLSELYTLVSICMTANQTSAQETCQLLPDMRQKLKGIQVSWSSVRRGTRALLAYTQISPELETVKQATGKIIDLNSRRASRGEMYTRFP